MKTRARWRQVPTVLIALAVCLPVWAQPAATGQGDPFGERALHWGTLPAALARVVVFHAAGSGTQSAARLYVDGRLQTALRPGGFTVWCIGAGTHEVSVAWGHVARLPNEYHPASRVVLGGGQTYYFRTGDDDVPVALGAPQAQELLSLTREQTHLLSRAPTQACPVAAAPG